MSTGTRPRETTGWTLRDVASETVRRFAADRGWDLAGSLAFTTLLTAIPLLATFSLFLAALFRENDEQILSVVNIVLPYQTARLTQNLRDFIAESTAITGVGLLLLVVASVRLVFVVEGVFNAVWGAPRRRAFLSRIILYTFALVALGLVLGGIGWGLVALRRWASMDSFVNSPVVGAGAPFLLKAFFLTLLYRYLPNARIRLRAAALAGAAVALALELLRLGFSFYVEALRRMNLITGSLVLILLMILSVYFAWFVILLGVELTHVLETTVLSKTHETEREGRAERAIRMLLRMPYGRVRPLAEIDRHPGAPSDQTLAILDELQRAGLVEGSAGDGFRLAIPAREITVARVVEALSPDLLNVSPREDRVTLVLEPLFSRLDAERRALLDATLPELRQRHEAESGVIRREPVAKT